MNKILKRITKIDVLAKTWPREIWVWDEFWTDVVYIVTVPNVLLENICALFYQISRNFRPGGQLVRTYKWYGYMVYVTDAKKA